MKIGSYNIRGLGSKLKRDEIFSFFTINNLDICCVQETKVEEWSEEEGILLWKKAAEVKWGYKGSMGRSGGVLTFWDDSKFRSSSHWSIGGAVVVVGIWRETREVFCIVNVYASCEEEEKRLLWDKLQLVVEQWSDVNLCLIGDFNSILEEGERVGVGGEGAVGRDGGFKEFVERHELYDVCLQGRKYTWYMSNGTSKSRIDRALINDRWAEHLQDTHLRGLPRAISDHYAIILNTSQADWGPKPFRFINAWLTNPSFLEMAESSWNKEGIRGWGCFEFKEKLKRLKG